MWFVLTAWQIAEYYQEFIFRKYVRTKLETCLCMDEEFCGVLLCSWNRFEDVGLCPKIIVASLLFNLLIWSIFTIFSSEGVSPFSEMHMKLPQLPLLFTPIWTVISLFVTEYFISIRLVPGECRCKNAVWPIFQCLCLTNPGRKR